MRIGWSVLTAALALGTLAPAGNADEIKKADRALVLTNWLGPATTDTWLPWIPF